MAKVYITKYALTAGVFSVDAEVNYEKNMAVYKRHNSSFCEYVFGKDYWLSEEGALNRAEEMRIAKLKSLDKQIKKVSAIKFEIKE